MGSLLNFCDLLISFYRNIFLSFYCNIVSRVNKALCRHFLKQSDVNFLLANELSLDFHTKTFAAWEKAYDVKDKNVILFTLEFFPLFFELKFGKMSSSKFCLHFFFNSRHFNMFFSPLICFMINCKVFYAIFCYIWCYRAFYLRPFSHNTFWRTILR